MKKTQQVFKLILSGFWVVRRDDSNEFRNSTLGNKTSKKIRKRVESPEKYIKETRKNTISLRKS
jgi:hypothetical protein